MIGLWDWDGVDGTLAWRTFARAPAIEKRVAEEGEALAAFIRSDLGDARSFSLDSPETRSARIADLLAAMVSSRERSRAIASNRGQSRQG